MLCLYGWECACWLRPGSTAFITWLGKKWRPLTGSPVGNQQGSFILAPPLPPLGIILTANPLHLLFSSDGIAAGGFSGAAPPPPAQRRRFKDIKTVEANGRRLLINGEAFLRTATPGLAANLAKRIRSLLKLSEAERKAAIEKMLRETFDAKAIEERWKQFEQSAADIRWLTNGLFLYVFVLIPLILWRFGLKMSWIGLLAGLLILTISIAISFRRAHKTFYPQEEDERFTHFLVIALSPVTAIRALDVVSRPLLETFHPLAVASVFCPTEKLHQMSEPIWRDIRFPALCGGESLSVAEEESRTVYRKIIENFLKRNKINPDKLLKPPQPLDDSCTAYCPRCLAQFIKTEGGCPDCGGRPLQIFEKPVLA